MKATLHAELEKLCGLYHSNEISEEEWALLQIHMGYCDGCHEKFHVLSLASATDNTSTPPLLIFPNAQG
jgi:hypothetical protein